MFKETKSGQTHSACNTRMKKEGGKATKCCFCEPHEDCEFKEIKKACFQAVILSEEATLKWLLTNAHGSGNWRRLCEQRLAELKKLHE